MDEARKICNAVLGAGRTDEDYESTREIQLSDSAQAHCPLWIIVFAHFFMCVPQASHTVVGFALRVSEALFNVSSVLPLLLLSVICLLFRCRIHLCVWCLKALSAPT